MQRSKKKKKLRIVKNIELLTEDKTVPDVGQILSLMFSGALRAMTVTPNPLQKCPTFLTLSLLFGFFKSPFFFVLVQCRSLPSYMTELLGLGRRGASRRCHRCGAVGSVLLWRSRFIYAVLRWRVSWTSAGSGGVLEEHGGFKSVTTLTYLNITQQLVVISYSALH